MLWRRLKRLFRYETPHQGDGADDPLYYTHARRVSRVGDKVSMRRFNRRVMGGMVAATAILVLLYLIVYLTNASTDALGTTLLLLTVLVFGVGWVVDFFCLLYGVNSIRQLQDGDMLDFIRVTTVSPTALMRARVRLARLYAWRGFFFVMGLRGVVGGVWALVWIVDIARMLMEASVADQARSLGMLIGLPATGIILLLREPYWRYRAFTEMGVRQASRFDNIYRVWWRVGLAWLGMWAALGAIYTLFLFGLSLVVLVATSISLYVYEYVMLSEVTVGTVSFLFALVVGFSPLMALRLVWLTLNTSDVERALTKSGMALLNWNEGR